MGALNLASPSFTFLCNACHYNIINAPPPPTHTHTHTMAQTHLFWDDCDNICISSYYHHHIRSMNHLPMFTVRSWNNGMRYMSLCCYPSTSRPLRNGAYILFSKTPSPAVQCWQGDDRRHFNRNRYLNEDLTFVLSNSVTLFLGWYQCGFFSQFQFSKIKSSFLTQVSNLNRVRNRSPPPPPPPHIISIVLTAQGHVG